MPKGVVMVKLVKFLSSYVFEVINYRLINRSLEVPKQVMAYL